MNAQTHMEQQLPVLIVGAGPTGLVLALWLTRLGVQVRIIDKALDVGTTSRALAVQARTLELYRQFGLADAVVDGGVRIAGINLWVQGDKAARVPFRDLGKGLSPYPFALVFPQDAHERLLTARLRSLGVEVERGTELSHLDNNEAAVKATLRLADGSEEIYQPRYVAGCDGASSKVREAIGAGFPGGTYAGMFYVADVETSGPVTDHELHIDLEDADFLAVFPLKKPGHVRLVGVISDVSGGADQSLGFDDVATRAVQQLQLAQVRVHWFSTYRVHHRVAKQFRQGRSFLLGDAAHIHSPVGGQGMNTGIGDAINLAWKLAAVCQSTATEALLDSYEPERIAFARRLVATTDRAFTFITRDGSMAKFVRTKLVPLLAPTLLRLGFVRHFMFRTVSQLNVHYRHSALSVGAAGKIHAGDRLPWIAGLGDDDNFAPLTSLAWQVHVYGEPHSGVAESCEELGVPLQVFAWQSAMQRVGFKRGALYLIRPDGYVALAGDGADPASLRDYFSKRGLRA